MAAEIMRPGSSFAKPWHLQVFSILNALHDQGVFTWVEWTQQLGKQLALQSALSDDEDAYHVASLAALECLLESRNLVDSSEIATILATLQTASDHGHNAG